jgi:dihydrofolate reductase
VELLESVHLPVEKESPVKVVVMNHVTLDGVMQAPGRADEDTRGGFEHGGWATPNSDEVVGRAMGEHMARSGGLAGWLFGRRTYEELLGHWNSVPDSPFAPALNNARKFVASRTLKEPLPWPNSTLLDGDVVEAVAALKAEGEGELGVMGSGALIQTLLPHNLIDEYFLMIHPLVLGSGRRLFPDGSPPTTLSLVASETASTGVLIATYAVSPTRRPGP